MADEKKPKLPKKAPIQTVEIAMTEGPPKDVKSMDCTKSSIKKMQKK
ncbi:MAG: hypothetical protein IMZ43_01075 [Thermoplasmata archaeon]|nr:hypothetical protein [Thermoplasmata archaeon]